MREGENEEIYHNLWSEKKGLLEYERGLRVMVDSNEGLIVMYGLLTLSLAGGQHVCMVTRPNAQICMVEF